jgi:hypothetical protein
VIFNRWFELLISLRTAIVNLLSAVNKSAAELAAVADSQRQLARSIQQNVAIAAMRTLDAGECNGPGRRITLPLHARDERYNDHSLRALDNGSVRLEGHPYRGGVVTGVRWVGDPLAWRCEAINGDNIISGRTEPLAAASGFIGQRIQPGLYPSLECVVLQSGAIYPVVVLFIAEDVQ